MDMLKNINMGVGAVVMFGRAMVLKDIETVTGRPEVRKMGTMDCVEEIVVGVFANKLNDEEIKRKGFLASV